jgi:uncharacterized protein (TIGR03435 family)
LWQSTLFAVAAALLMLALRRNQARVRYGLWLAASLKFLIPFSLLISLGGYLARPDGSVNVQSSLYSVVELAAQPFTLSAAPVATPIARAASAAHRLSLLPDVLAIVWLCGFVAVLSVWWLRWQRISAAIERAARVSQGREVDALRRLERIGGVRKPIAFLLSRNSMEPGIFGIVRPVLVWPAGISERLDDVHLEAILVHEICHVRRRDNLAAAVHMLVEAIFWFHPLVWWLGARLIEERERACDEAVLQSGNPPHVYAESILKTCEFCVGSSLACVSGVTGDNLKRRIVDIMARRVAAKLDFSKKVLLGMAGLLAVAVPIVFGQITAAQRGDGPETANVDAKIPAFEVASIKPDKSGSGMSMMRFTPDGFNAKNIPLQFLLREAYGVEDDQISGAPNWAGSERYDIEAKVDGADVAKLNKLSFDQRRLMFQPLLEDRFKLKTHWETKELPIYVLVKAKSGAKLHEAKPDDMYPDGVKGPDGAARPGRMMMMGRGQVTGQDVPLTFLTKMLSQQLRRTIVDKTGLTGKYDFTLQWTPDESQGPMSQKQPAIQYADQGPAFPKPPGAGQATGSTTSADSSGASIFTAIQEQLGLKLEPQKGPVKVLVIDGIEKPSEN